MLYIYSEAVLVRSLVCRAMHLLEDVNGIAPTPPLLGCRKIYLAITRLSRSDHRACVCAFTHRRPRLGYILSEDQHATRYSSPPPNPIAACITRSASASTWMTGIGKCCARRDSRPALVSLPRAHLSLFEAGSCARWLVTSSAIWLGAPIAVHGT